MAIPFDQIPIGEGRHPNGELGAAFFLYRPELSALEDHGPQSQLDDARFILETVREPDAIFEGLKDDNDATGLCYSVRPTHDPFEPESETLPRYGFVFLAYVRPGVGGYVVFGWEWWQEDETPGLPLNWQNDYTRRVWLKT